MEIINGQTKPSSRFLGNSPVLNLNQDLSKDKSYPRESPLHSTMTQYLYLHGFASSPQSKKAQAFKQQFDQLGVPLQIPDLNQGDFSRLSLSRQIRQVQEVMAQGSDPWVLIGSSFGGLTAAWMVEQPGLQEQIEALVLLAPAFQFLAQWLPRLGPDQLAAWQSRGTLAVFHYSEQRNLPLYYDFVKDAQQYPDDSLKQVVPTLVIHGIHDDVISVESSRAYAATRPWVTLVEVDSDHALVDVQDEIWQHVQAFLDL
jgi:pimeloyl-ACP methyl ester carboxylesterase